MPAIDTGIENADRDSRSGQPKVGASLGDAEVDVGFFVHRRNPNVWFDAEDGGASRQGVDLAGSHRRRESTDEREFGADREGTRSTPELSSLMSLVERYDNIDRLGTFGEDVFEGVGYPVVVGVTESS